MNYYLDTNIIIYTLKKKYPAIVEHFSKVSCQSVIIPNIVMAEIEYGAQKSNDYKKTIELYSKFTDIFEKDFFDDKAAKIYGKIRNELQSEGHLIGANDLLIASIVMANDGILVTHNTKEFSRIKGLKMEDWTE